jgi:quercetin dioxygenase-like cupin family protein
MKPAQLLAIVFVAVNALAVLASQAQQLSGISRTDLQRHDLSAPGYEVLQTRVDFAPGAAAPAHTHNGEEIIYVLSGTLEYRLTGGSPVTLRAGEVLFVPGGVAHEARNVGDGVASELATYVVLKGRPLLTPAQ